MVRPRIRRKLESSDRLTVAVIVSFNAINKAEIKTVEWSFFEAKERVIC